MKNVGLVFAGGGVKGSYQIGVWRALDELGFKFDAVVGTSIGSINGALFVMGAFEMAEKLWSEITIEKIVNIEAQSDNLFDIKNIFILANEIYKNNGLDTTPLRQLLEECIDEDAIRKSPMDFALVTHSLTDRKEMPLFKEDIPKGRMVDYILASACLPGFKSQVIDNKTFIDGAINNNMPVDVLIRRGIKNIVAVDVGGIGVVKDILTPGTNIFTVRCSENVLGTMDFDSENIVKSIKMGYYDCYKTFGKLMGEKYYFNTNDYCIAKCRYSEEMLANLELAAEAFGINNLAVYKVDALVDGVLRGYYAAEKRYNEIKDTLSVETLWQAVGKGLSQLDDALAVVWVIDQLKQQNFEILNSKIVLGVLGDNFNAASAVCYFMSEER